MRSFLITVACFAALAGGVALAYVAVEHPLIVAQTWNNGAASAVNTATSVVSSVVSSVATGHDSGPAPSVIFPAHDNWTWQTTDGKTYENVVITSLGATDVTISHAGGIAHVPLNTLPPDVLGEINSAAATASTAAPTTTAAAPSPATAAPAPSEETAGPGPATPMEAMLRNELVDLHGAPVPNPGSNVKHFAIYYSAGWCPPCHAFTPTLVSWYLRFKRTHPDFELIFVSNDHSEADMYSYMQEMQMPWPAVKYSELPGNGILKYAGSGIPDLVLVDANGSVLADSFNGSTYLGPQTVVDYMDAKLGAN